jgi:hypothetical protein
MIINDNDHILFIEPTHLGSTEGVQDELTAKMKQAMLSATKPEWHYKGVHICVCGAVSDNNDYFLPNGQKTNSLAVHYLEFHRDDVPESELAKVRNM